MSANNRYLTPQEARRFYDRFGRRQDRQAFYEDAALAALIDHLDLETARDVFEFGCGTGRLAARILSERLPPDARLAACDLSGEMVAIAAERLSPFGARVKLWQSGETPDFTPGAPPFDVILSSYVLDLMPPDAIAAMLAESARGLRPDGRIGLVSLTEGNTPLSRMTSALWGAIARRHPGIVGGCRPIRLVALLRDAGWNIEWHRIVRAVSIPSEVVVARPPGKTEPS